MGICEFKPIKIDLKNPSYIYEKKCKQNDTLILNFTVLDDCIAADLTNYSCVMNVNKNDTAYEIRDTDITPTGNNIKIKCPSSTSQIAGTLKLELKFFEISSGMQKTSFDIEIEVKKSVLADTNGNVTPAIMTQLEHLDKSLSEVESTISKAEQTNNNLKSTNNTATGNISALSTQNANSIINKSSLDDSIADAEVTIEELKQTNSQYTQHINNADIHVTKPEKDKWNAYDAKITELTNIIDNFIYSDSTVTDDDGNNVTDDNNENVIM